MCLSIGAPKSNKFSICSNQKIYFEISVVVMNFDSKDIKSWLYYTTLQVP